MIAPSSDTAPNWRCGFLVTHCLSFPTHPKVPSGEIAIKDLAALATALQELTTRISRDPINTPGPGRTKQFMEELSQLASAPGPDIDGGIDLTDDEFQAFLQAARS